MTNTTLQSKCTYAADAARSSVFLAPVNKPNSPQNMTVNIAISPSRVFVPSTKLSITTETIGTSDATQIANPVTNLNTGLRE